MYRISYSCLYISLLREAPLRTHALSHSLSLLHCFAPSIPLLSTPLCAPHTNTHTHTHTQTILGSEGSIIGYCDDGNAVNGDGCSRDCQEECGYECSGGNASVADICKTFCGDGVRRDGIEDCDDGNTVNNDGCSSGCQVEVEWTCSMPHCSQSICQQPDASQVCGDGMITGTEALVTGFCEVNLNPKTYTLIRKF
jgi:cysteine-rich repeat protein